MKLKDARLKYKYKSQGADYLYDLAPCFGGFEGHTTNTDRPYVLVRDSRLMIREGYEWNGANHFPDFPWVLRASFVHDALCQLLDEGRWRSRVEGKDEGDYRKCADREFYCIVRSDKGLRWASITYSAIRGHVQVPFVGGIIGGAIGLVRGERHFECGQAVEAEDAATG
ncbi:MAG: hypothetical protein OXC70_05295 [Gammaproteobacteria bacterium]|nr:hypothetical protein [Gammaproteobacteria bacterium]